MASAGRSAQAKGAMGKVPDWLWYVAALVVVGGIVLFVFGWEAFIEWLLPVDVVTVDSGSS